jgi:hypothetical protein
MAVEELTIVFKHATLDAEFALKAIQAELGERHVPSTGFELDQEPVDLAKVWPRLKRAGWTTFNLVGRGFVFDLGSVRNFQLDFLGIKAIGEHPSAWDKWVAGFIGNPNFVMGWLADVEYEHWQNAHDLLQYTAVGKPHEHLPKKSNGLPPPLEQTIIDISGNPGRRILRNGYYEVVGAVMWLGEPFWQLTKANKVEIERSQWLQLSEPRPTVVRIEASAECFTTAEGTSGELQQKLRTLLFPETAASPPNGVK